MKTLRHLDLISRQFACLSVLLVQVRHYCISVRDKAAQTCAKSWKLLRDLTKIAFLLDSARCLTPLRV